MDTTTTLLQQPDEGNQTAGGLPGHKTDLQHVLIIPYYVCDKQLSFSELNQLIQQHQYDPRAEEEVHELIKNDIIKKAYTKGDELWLYVQDSLAHTSRYEPRPKINYSMPIILDYSDPVTISSNNKSFENVTIYPHAVLAYTIIGGYSITQYLKDGTQIQIYAPEDVVGAFKSLMKRNKITYLPIKEQAFRKYEKMLIAQGAQLPLKDTTKKKK